MFGVFFSVGIVDLGVGQRWSIFTDGFEPLSSVLPPLSRRRWQKLAVYLGEDQRRVLYLEEGQRWVPSQKKKLIPRDLEENSCERQGQKNTCRRRFLCVV